MRGVEWLAGLRPHAHDEQERRRGGRDGKDWFHRALYWIRKAKPIACIMESTCARIDELDRATSVKDLARQLKAILGDFAYYISQSEGVINDTHEDWRHNYARALRSEMQSEGAAPSDGVPIGAAPSRPPVAPSRPPAAPRRESRRSSHAARQSSQQGPQQGSRAIQQLPPSLQAIFSGTSPLLRDDSD